MITNSKIANDPQSLHLVRLSVWQIKTIIDVLRRRAVRPRSSTRLYAQCQEAAKTFERLIEGRRRIESIDFSSKLPATAWLCRLISAEGEPELAFEIVAQISEGAE